MSPSKSAPAKKRRKKRAGGGNLLTSVVLILPLMLLYGVGVLFTDTLNGADLVTQNLLSLVGPRGYLWFQGGLLVTLVASIFYLRRKQQLQIWHFTNVFLESAIYALTMGTLIIFVMVDLFGIDPRLAAAGPLANASIFDKLVMSIGAGVHEELLFRLVIMGGLIVLGQEALKLRHWLALLGAVVISSLLFSAAHHVGDLGEPLRLGVFVYRVMAGVVFALLYRFRSFAIAVYTHTLYDIYVMIFAA